MSTGAMWQVQVRSQMLHDQWNDLSDHSTEAAALESVDRYHVTHPGREYRILRFVVAEIIDPEIRRRPTSPEYGVCSCTEHETYRQLDRDCPKHGDAADARRRQGDAT